jgi:hypothetical protein
MTTSGTTPTQTAPPPTPRKKRRVFLWFYLALQVIFLIWIIAGAQANHCNAQGSQLANNACTAGTGIGIALVIALWVAVDVIVGGTYAIYRLASRSR